jgi:hypothetical protein
LRSTALLANRIIAAGQKKHDNATMPNLDLSSYIQSRRQRLLLAGRRGFSNPDLSGDGANLRESHSVRRQRHRKRRSLSSESMAMVNQSNPTTSVDLLDFFNRTSSPPGGPEQQKQQVWFRRRLRVQEEAGVATHDAPEPELVEPVQVHREGGSSFCFLESPDAFE